ncbi:MAG: hypothetical protein ABIT01_19445 [Thermoanaerobaculia bacterium]
MKTLDRILVGLVTSFVLGTAGTAAAQNVVLNPDFAGTGGSLTSWTTTANASANATDWQAVATSGSAQGDALSANGNKTVITQCVLFSAVANPSFGFGGQISVTNASGATGASRAQITAQFFSATNCTTAVGAVFTVGISPIATTTPFALFALTAQTTPATAQSALISINVQRLANTGNTVALFDHIFLGAGLTAPVELQHFQAE